MANLAESPVWEPGVYQLEEEDVVLGGVDGIDNVQAKQLANRTAYLKALYESLSSIVSALGLDKQPLDDTLSALADLSTTADKLIYTTGVDQFSLTPLTEFIRTLLDDADAAAARTTLGAAPINSPTFSGSPKGPTPPPGTKNTQLATTEFVGNYSGFEIFRNSGVFIAPTNTVFVTLVGGGGGGAGSINGAPYSGGGGGGGGVVYRDRIAVIPGEPYSVQIGAGGSGGYGSSGGGTYANSNGAGGGITSFGSLRSVSGGGGGNCQSLEAHGGSPGSAEFSSVGGSGDAGEHGGVGGGCLYAPSLSAGHSSVTGALFGGGGSGGRGSIFSENGGNGGQGLCIIEWG